MIDYPTEVPPLTEDAVRAAVASKNDGTWDFSDTDFGYFVDQQALVYGAGGLIDPQTTRFFYGMYYTALRASGTFPEVSEDSLTAAVKEVFEKSHGVRIEDVDDPSGLQRDFGRYLMGEFRPRLRERNPLYLGLMAELAKGFDQGDPGLREFILTVGVTVYLAVEKDITSHR